MEKDRPEETANSGLWSVCQPPLQKKPTKLIYWSKVFAEFNDNEAEYVIGIIGESCRALCTRQFPNRFVCYIPPAVHLMAIHDIFSIDKFYTPALVINKSLHGYFIIGSPVGQWLLERRNRREVGPVTSHTTSDTLALSMARQRHYRAISVAVDGRRPANWCR